MEWILIRYSAFLLSVYLTCFNIILREELYKLEVCGSGIDKAPKNPVECLGWGGGGGCALDWLSTPLLSGGVVKACYTDIYIRPFSTFWLLSTICWILIYFSHQSKSTNGLYSIQRIYSGLGTESSSKRDPTEYNLCISLMVEPQLTLKMLYLLP